MTIIPTYVNYTGNGTQTDFSFPFAYLVPDQVMVYVGGIETTFELITQGTVRITPAPTTNTPIQIKRLTSTVPLVVWTDGGMLTGNDVNKATTQALHVAEEGRDANTSISDTAVAAATSAANAAQNAFDYSEAASAALEDALAAVGAFAALYLGARGSDPSTGLDGVPLVAGQLYFSTAIGQLRVWDGATWVTAANIPAHSHTLAQITDMTALGRALGATASVTAARTSLEIALASTAEAQGGSESSHFMTPLRTAEAIAARSPVQSVNGATGAVTVTPNTGNAPTASASWPVGSWGMFRVASGSVADGATISGSNIRVASLAIVNEQFTVVSGSSVSGTWKNLSGYTIGGANSTLAGYFVRVS